MIAPMLATILAKILAAILAPNPQPISGPRSFRSSVHPKRRSIAMMERNSGLVKLRAKKLIAARFPTSARTG